MIPSRIVAYNYSAPCSLIWSLLTIRHVEPSLARGGHHVSFLRVTPLTEKTPEKKTVNHKLTGLGYNMLLLCIGHISAYTGSFLTT